ncbi:dTTP/UTP pyrophosphatase [Bombus vosnesenskii]|uniref:dTTP/UTP pyrophosphatase n=3 Tax=Pyrobombus TaxID=144703 RepID=A0A6J3L0M0_9HYME|nr:dTTP/UTP pyrophosphatase [Bombus impatiens]XP_033192179.1 dTTP/UTP pyrophosphatase [Bombus vancouverensis nearcticus]XP_033309410.1 dTTP/UTP pyrophosphatase [Bombus bifarius]XP_033357991.1 dTTP/UTP pyrophosphatase [Bombus vosnesenskii]XP_050480926.1 dTTP/UTP pyrophosphatase [Bombus huntii]
MFEQVVQVLTAGRVVLASGSPRRYEIMKQLGINIEVVSSTYDENLDRSAYKNSGDYVQDLAKYKVQEVYDRLKEDVTPPSLIIGADTLVTMGDVIYGKPKNNLHAFEMLSSLANKEHIVYTGVCLKTPKKEVNFYESTKVKFGDISEEQIWAYIKSGEPLDKAGGYGVQGLGGCLIEKIDGDFYTVMGLPLYSLTKRLNEMFGNN